MKRRNFFSCLLGNLAWLLLPGCSDPLCDPNSDAPASGAGGSASKSPPSPAESAAQAAYEKENQARMEAARLLEGKKARLAQAVAQTKDYRRRLQYLNASAWTKWIDERTPIFQSLRENAARSHTKTVQCTICDGTGQTSTCVICQSTHKCSDCHGTGKLLGGAVCPTCQGNGKCFLCHGAGKMACPFCDDGLVYAGQSAPPKVIPIE